MIVVPTSVQEEHLPTSVLCMLTSPNMRSRMLELIGGGCSRKKVDEGEGVVESSALPVVREHPRVEGKGRLEQYLIINRSTYSGEA